MNSYFQEVNWLLGHLIPRSVSVLSLQWVQILIEQTSSKITDTQLHFMPAMIRWSISKKWSYYFSSNELPPHNSRMNHNWVHATYSWGEGMWSNSQTTTQKHKPEYIHPFHPAIISRRPKKHTTNSKRKWKEQNSPLLLQSCLNIPFLRPRHHYWRNQLSTWCSNIGTQKIP